ncbi:hypothetical protein ACFQ2H_04505 [Streptomyces violaceoruber]
MSLNPLETIQYIGPRKTTVNRATTRPKTTQYSALPRGRASWAGEMSVRVDIGGFPGSTRPRRG